MKKIVALLLALLLSFSLAALAEEIVNTGIWEKRAYVDEFDLPTDEYYISNKTPIIGKFSNSATTDSELKSYLIIDTNYIGIKLIEYGDNIVKNSYSKSQVYNTVMMDPAGEKYYFDGYMSSGSDRIIYSEETYDLILSALCKNGTVRFAITEENNPTTKYIITIDDTTGIIQFLPVDTIYDVHEGRAEIGINGQYGYIDTSGNIVIQPQYTDAGMFSEGLACVVKGGKWGYIDTEGNEVIPFIYDNANLFSNGLAEVSLNGKIGFIDKTGIPSSLLNTMMLRDFLKTVLLQ